MKVYIYDRPMIINHVPDNTKRMMTSDFKRIPHAVDEDEGERIVDRYEYTQKREKIHKIRIGDESINVCFKGDTEESPLKAIKLEVKE